MRTPLTAPLTLPQLPQPGLPGAYSVELVSLALVSPPNSNLTQLLLQATWHLFLRHLVTMVVAVCLSFFGLVSDLSSQVPRRRWSQPRSGSHTHSTKSTHEKCERLFFFFNLVFLAAALSHSRLYQVLHPSATRQTECGSGKFTGN